MVRIVFKIPPRYRIKTFLHFRICPMITVLIQALERLTKCGPMQTRELAIVGQGLLALREHEVRSRPSPLDGSDGGDALLRFVRINTQFGNNAPMGPGADKEPPKWKREKRSNMCCQNPIIVLKARAFKIGTP